MITIVTASWGNEDQSAAIVNTVERGHKAISQKDTPDEWAAFLAWRQAGNAVRAIEDGAAYRAAQEREVARTALKTAANAKLAKLGITADELKAILDL